jgi:prepilin-type N-terminal cleavage/methylation domain-containing protein
MKTNTRPFLFALRRGTARMQGFTLAEMMIASAVFTLAIGGVIASHLYGMRMYEIAKAKLGVTYEARTTLMTLLTDVRSATEVNIGTGTATTFTEAANGALQQGNSIRIFPSTNQSQYIQYFKDSSGMLKRYTNGMATPTVVVHSITNSVVFLAEDFRGNVLTNNQNNRVIHLFLEFYQVQYPIVPIPGQLFEYYRWQTKMTRRTL